MDKQNLLSEALMGVRGAGEKLQLSDEINSLRGSFKHLSKAALIGLILAGCSGEGNGESADESQTDQQSQPVLSNIITGFNASNCRDVSVSAVYREPIVVKITDIANAENSVQIDLQGTIDPQTGELSNGSKTFLSPVSELVRLEVVRQSDNTPVEFCHLSTAEDCIRGDHQAYCRVVE